MVLGQSKRKTQRQPHCGRWHRARAVFPIDPWKLLRDEPECLFCRARSAQISNHGTVKKRKCQKKIPCVRHSPHHCDVAKAYTKGPLGAPPQKGAFVVYGAVLATPKIELGPPGGAHPISQSFAYPFVSSSTSAPLDELGSGTDFGAVQESLVPAQPCSFTAFLVQVNHCAPRPLRSLSKLIIVLLVPRSVCPSVRRPWKRPSG